MASYMEFQGITKGKRSMSALGVKSVPGWLHHSLAYLMLLTTSAALGQTYISPNVPVVRCNLTPIACLSGACGDQEILALYLPWYACGET